MSTPMNITWRLIKGYVQEENGGTTMCDMCNMNTAQRYYYPDQSNPNISYETMKLCEDCWNHKYRAEERDNYQKWLDEI